MNWNKWSPRRTYVRWREKDSSSTKPLYYQFQAERAGEFEWEYEEQGPEVWRVRIGKIK